MSQGLEVKEGQSFQDGTGLTVRVADVDDSDRAHFSVTGDTTLATSRYCTVFGATVW